MSPSQEDAPTVYFKNPDNGYIERTGLHWLWTLCFGPFYFAYRGAWPQFCITFFIPFASFIMVFFARSSIINNYKQKGWARVSPEEAEKAGCYTGPENVGRAILAPLVPLIAIIVVFNAFGLLFSSSTFKTDAEMAPNAAVAALEAIASEEAAAAAAALAGPDRVKIDSPELNRYEQTYFEIESEITSNLNNSRKVVQVKVYIMTLYDERVIAHMEKHDIKIREALKSIMSYKTESDLARPTFRKELAEEFRLEINSILKRLEDFGGIESVGFVAFVVQ